MRLGTADVRTWLLGLVLSATTLPAFAQDKGGTATTPAPRDQNWLARHESFLKRAEQGDVDLLFLGDSITQGWNENATWKRYYGPRRAANFGIGGDRTQHVLWRLEHGEVDKIRPKVVVLMIGTNNLSSNTDDEIAAGVTAIVETLRKKLPETKVLLLGIFPRGGRRDKDQTAADVEPRVAKINATLARLDDGKTVKYLDIGKHFLDPEGRLPKELMPDFLHLSPRGYAIWAEAIEPTLWEMLEGK